MSFSFRHSFCHDLMAKEKSLSVKVTGLLSGSSLPRLDTVDSHFKFLKTSWGLWDQKVKRQPQKKFTCTEPEDPTVCLWRHRSIFDLNKANANCSPITIRRHLWEKGLSNKKHLQRPRLLPGHKIAQLIWTLQGSTKHETWKAGEGFIL